jgi:hypothetical protein
MQMTSLTTFSTYQINCTFVSQVVCFLMFSFIVDIIFLLLQYAASHTHSLLSLLYLALFPLLSVWYKNLWHPLPTYQLYKRIPWKNCSHFNGNINMKVVKNFSVTNALAYYHTVKVYSTGPRRKCSHLSKNNGHR